METELEINNISFRIGKVDILKDIFISIEKPGIRVSLLGPSGCGKTTLLRIISGLDKPSKGSVMFRGKDIAHVPPHKRNFGMMFQDFALFPHRNVFKNISFGLEMKGFSRKEIAERVSCMLELVNLEGYDRRDIKELSGGERQRVALARTLAPYPDLIMLDEPLGALDRLLRERLLADLCKVLDGTGITAILVTHDHQEAFTASDFVCVMDNGKVSQIDSPERLYKHPVNKQVADFLGFQNITTGKTIRDGKYILSDFDSVADYSLDKCSPSLNVKRIDKNIATDGDTVTLLIMPDAAEIVSEKNIMQENALPKREICLKRENVIIGKNSLENNTFPDFFEKETVLENRVHHCNNIIEGIITDAYFQGAIWKVFIKTSHGKQFSFNLPCDAKVAKKGEKILLRIKSSGIKRLDAEG
ncbi:putative ABC-type transporter, ATP-binding protein [Desulfamplus magnetovallimortis]|uniref:Putative ABC-type transporter, ATP-binding protein n=1 Tax=Desulfamplus magnetovallimortis TaxID=1246637 RepID=A0A1W1H4F8_9BACT|nr:ABC transporter ATP-binding protein [Desulfamplus magnetovallimortis]SLM27347.1 putative ABC-type transporter, ATP-binding protein [Desulfamplus magnetovallimortis]